MDKLTKQILSGSSAAAMNLVKSLITNPMLINADPTQEQPWSISLEVEDEAQNVSAEVSESLLIADDTKTNVADNVAPGSWTWDLSGYIGGIPELQYTNYYTPFVTHQVNYLKMAAKKGFILQFKDSDCALYRRVVIQSLTIRQEKDCRNKRPFSMSLKEINVINSRAEFDTGVASYASVAAGAAIGPALTAGTTLAQKTVLKIDAKVNAGVTEEEIKESRKR